MELVTWLEHATFSLRVSFLELFVCFYLTFSVISI
jgi:hypothetical protein